MSATITAPQHLDMRDYTVSVGSLCGGVRLVRPDEQVHRVSTKVQPEFTGRWKTVVQGGGQCDLYVEVVLSACETITERRFLRAPKDVTIYYAVTMWVHESVINMVRKDIVTINECECDP